MHTPTQGDETRFSFLYNAVLLGWLWKQAQVLTRFNNALIEGKITKLTRLKLMLHLVITIAVCNGAVVLYLV